MSTVASLDSGTAMDTRRQPTATGRFDIDATARVLLDEAARRWWERAAARPAIAAAPPGGLPPSLDIGEQPGPLAVALKELEAAAARANNPRSPCAFDHVPNGGVRLSGEGRRLADALGVFTGVASEAADLAALDAAVIRLWCDLAGLPAGTSGGLLTTGASLGALHAILAARQTAPRRTWRRCQVYVTAHTHHSVAKAAAAAGVAVRLLPTTADLRVDIAAAQRLIRWDRWRGRRPLMLVATAGSTDTGTIDRLGKLAQLARQHRMWLHVDAAYGGAFLLTARGRRALAGIHLADSITLDGHKSLGLIYESSALLVANVATLRAAFTGQPGPYMPPVDEHGPASPAALGLELTRGFRGLQWWLPLFGHGLGAFTEALDRQLDLAHLAHQTLSADPAFEPVGEPDLATVTFRLRGGDRHDHDRFLAALAAQGIGLSATTIHGRPAVRMCIGSHRTQHTHITTALAAIQATARETRCGL